jgi:hypothetical protein
MILECPHEVTTFDFNPYQHNIIAGGCSNGQLVQWEISDDVMQRAAQVGTRLLASEQPTRQLNVLLMCCC